MAREQRATTSESLLQRAVASCEERPNLTRLSTCCCQSDHALRFDGEQLGTPPLFLAVVQELEVTIPFPQLGGFLTLFRATCEFEENNSSRFARPDDCVRPFETCANDWRVNDVLVSVIHEEAPIIRTGE